MWSRLSNCMRSWPTSSTTPYRLRQGYRGSEQPVKIQDCPDFFFWKINAIFLSHPLFGNHLSLNPQTGPRPEFCYRRFIFRATKGDQTLLFSWRNKLVCVCRTSAASVELLPRGWRAVAFSRLIHVQSCSRWLIRARSCKMGLYPIKCDKKAAQVSKSVLFGWFCLRKFAQRVLIIWGGVPM